MQRIMYKDSFLSTEPVGKIVESPEYEWVPSRIVYDKGAAIVRMVEGFIGKEPFSRAIKKYLRDFSYGNADRDAVWTYFQEVSLLIVGNYTKLPPLYNIRTNSPYKLIALYLIFGIFFTFFLLLGCKRGTRHKKKLRLRF